MAGALPVDVTDSDMWGCQEDENWLQRNSRHGISHLWDDDNLDNLCCMFEEHTPIKECVDFGYHIPNNEENMIKMSEGSRESSQCKRRRMLQFNSDVADIGFCNEQLASLVKSKAREEELSLEDRFTENLQCTSEFSEDGCAFSNGDLDQSSEGWLAYCFNESDINISSEEMNDWGASDAQVDISEYCTIPPEMETDPVPYIATPTPCSNKSKGGKSFIKPPMKSTTSVAYPSVAYPFALIKPCGVQGDVTLKDINQRIHAPPSRAKDMKKEDSSHCYSTSAFSGKPVVVKTKIRTEGGKGSITILRTKG